jgi:hypothetical protein
MINKERTNVVCQQCNRVIGQRDHDSFYQPLKYTIDRSGKVPCPFPDCGHANPFRTNRNKNSIEQITVDKSFLTM